VNKNGGDFVRENNENAPNTFTVSGTNVDEVKSNNEHSGMTYNEVKELLAKTNGSQDAGNNYNDNNLEK
jgi:hypothetical protein